MKYVLDQCSLEELDFLAKTNYVPDWNNQRQQAPELLARHLVQHKEKKLGGGSRIDVVSAFKLRWNLGLAAEKQLRGLPHKDMRYVLANFDGSGTLEEIITEASTQDEDDDETAANACPQQQG